MSFEVIPSVVATEPAVLARQIRKIEVMADKVQIDFMDEHFVPLLSITPKDLASIKTDLRLIAHLMVLEPETYLEPLVATGVETIIFHYETTSNPSSLIQNIREKDMEVAVAIKLDTPTEVLDPLVSQVDFVVFLAVVPQTFGSPFQRQVLEKIAAFRKNYPGVRIGVDGGIRPDNIKFVKHLGVDRIYISTAIFASGDPLKNFQALKEAAAQAQVENID